MIEMLDTQTHKHTHTHKKQKKWRIKWVCKQDNESRKLRKKCS